MDHIYQNLKSPKVSRAVIVIIFLITGLIINWSTFSGDPVFDDYAFLFNSPRFVGAPSFFSFWDRFSEYFRSWPLSFSLLWLIYKSFGVNFAIFKTINIFLHIGNSLLISKVSKEIGIKFYLLVGFLFLIHPAQIETVSWIFQFKTLLSLFLFLCSFICFKKYFEILESQKRIIYLLAATTLFCLSNYSKIAAIFYIFLMAWFALVRKNAFNFPLRFKVELTLFFVLSLGNSFQTGTETLKGVDFAENEKKEKLYYENVYGGGDKTEEKEKRNLSLFYSKDFTEQTVMDGSVINIYIKTVSFYISHFFINSYNSLVYPKSFFKQRTGSLYLLVGIILLGLFGLLAINKGISSSWFIGILIYFLGIIPVSGIEYVPYMKFSLVADHWGYCAYWGAAILLVELLAHLFKHSKSLNKRGLYAVFFVVSLSLFIKHWNYNKIFNDEVQVIRHAIKYNPEELTLKLALQEIYYRDSGQDRTQEILDNLYEDDFDKLDASTKEFLLQEFQKSGDKDKEFRLVETMAMDAIKSQDPQQIQKIVDHLREYFPGEMVTKYFIGLQNYLMEKPITEGVF